MGSVRRKSAPLPEALYDKFLETLPNEDETPSTLGLDKVLSYCKKERVGESSEGSEHSTKSSDGDQSLNAGAGTEKSFNEEETKEFLRKIYEPVDSSKIPLSELEEPKPKSNSMEMVVRRMLKHLGVEEEIVNSISNVQKLPGLLYALHLQLKGKRYLILLDDVREEDEYYGKLVSCLRNGHGFPTGHGGVVIVTSRKEESVTKMVEKQNLHLHRLVPISDPESCWPIYQNMALGYVKTKDTDPKEVKDELKNKCGGLPLAARIMGEEGSKEASATSKVGPKETLTASKDGQKNQAPVISEDGPNPKEASTASKDVVSAGDGDGPEEESAVSKDGSSQASTASTKPDLQPETNQNQA
ncbi:Disease resistance protein [Corchorus capsularis]|uniref:Disease resistance protein n=1 Tax=Corchorus capsularis TaxID=210143 RepID=A0A1R3IYZ0_COCAP|nr:Disease resistance protein [Corchorus capsularis]